MKLSILLILISAQFSAYAQHENWPWSVGVNRDSLRVSMLKTNHDGYTLIQYDKSVDSVYGANVDHVGWQQLGKSSTTGTTVVLNAKGEVVSSKNNNLWNKQHGELISRKSLISNPFGGFIWIRTRELDNEIICYALLLDTMLEVGDSIYLFQKDWPATATSDVLFDYDWEGSVLWLAATKEDALANDSLVIAQYDFESRVGTFHLLKNPGFKKIVEIHFTYTKSQKFLVVETYNSDYSSLLQLNNDLTISKQKSFSKFGFDDIAGGEQALYLICDDWDGIGTYKRKNRVVLRYNEQLTDHLGFELPALESNVGREYVHFSRTKQGVLNFGVLSGLTSTQTDQMMLSFYDEDFNLIDSSLLNHKVLNDNSIEFDYENYSHVLALRNCTGKIQSAFSEQHFNDQLFDVVDFRQPHSFIYGIYPNGIVVRNRNFCDSLVIDYQAMPYQTNVVVTYPKGLTENDQVFTITNNKHNADSILFSYTGLFGKKVIQSNAIKFIAKPTINFLFKDSICTHQNAEIAVEYLNDTFREVFNRAIYNSYLRSRSLVLKNDSITIDSTDNSLFWFEPKEAENYQVMASFNNGFCAVTKEQDLYVKPAADARFRFSPNYGKELCTPSKYAIIDQSTYSSSPSITRYYLDDVEMKEPILVPNDTMIGNKYRVYQRIEHQNGCVSTYSHPANIYAGFIPNTVLYPRLVENRYTNTTYIEWDSLSMRYVEMAKNGKDAKLIYSNNYTDYGKLSDAFVSNYSFNYVGYCDKKSKKAYFSNLLLSYNISKRKFTWNDPMAGENFTFLVERLEDGQWKAVQESKDNYFVVSERDHVYRVRAISSTVPTIFISNQIHLGHLYQFPTAFSPNGDDVNDVLAFNTLQDADFEVIVFNKLGEILGRSNDALNIWDGTFNGKACPVGIYYYQCTIGEETFSGVIHLVK